MKKLIFLSTILAFIAKGSFGQITFNYTGAVQTYTVPPCVFQLNVSLWGAEGGGTGGSGGDGALVTGILNVTPGQVLQVYVGGMGGVTAGGFNGGGAGQPGIVGSGGGGGASDIRVAPYALANRVAVAGGGGGTGGGDQYELGGSGGDPDGTVGGTAFGSGGSGGTTFAGGAGGSYWTPGGCGSPLNNGQPGVLGFGGAGGIDVCHGIGPGGGGGGGLYGGGGGGSDDITTTVSYGGGGGGGGSSLVPAAGTATVGANTGNGKVTITPIGGSTPVTVTPVAPTICSGSSTVLTAAGATTYTWSPATGLSATTGASVTASPTTTTTYTVTGTTGGCSSTTTAIVTVNPLPIVNVPSASKCAGSPAVTLTASGALTYTWSPATGLSATTGTSVTANPAATTTYTITGTSAAGCVGTTTTIVTVNPLPTITCAPATICTGFSTPLTASGASTYTWSPATGLSATTGTTVTASPASTTTYTISGTSAAGCVSSTTVIVTVNPSPTVTCAPAIICNGLSTTLTATGASTYTWSPATGLSATTGTTVTASPTTTTTYTITGTSAAGCVGTTTTIVTVNPLPTVTCPAAAICNGSGTTLTASGAATYTWSPATGLSATTGTSVTASPTTTTTYTITGTSAAGCVSSGTVIVTVNPIPTITVNNPNVCLGNSVVLTAAGASTYSWSPATGLSATTGTSVTSTPLATTTYTISGTSTAGCVGTGTSIVSITALADPTILPQPAVCQSAPIVNFTAVDAGGTWSATCGACINAATGDFDPSMATVGVNTITYTIPGSCGGTDTETITVNADADATINPAGPLCSTSGIFTMVPVQTGGTWSATCGACINTATGDFDPSLASIGINTITYTIGGPCGDVQTTTIDVQSVTITSAPTTNALCNGGTGTITVNATGATSYSIDGGITFQASNVFTTVAGTYNVIAQNALGCQATTTITISEPTPLVAPTSFTNETCFGACDGIAGTAPSGGTSPYFYSWSTGATGVPFISSLCSGTYTVNVSDNNGCAISASVTINGPVSVTITSVTPTAPLCNGGTDGSIIINASATATNFSIDGGATFQPSNTFTGLTAGVYTIEVTDAGGCSATATTTITEPTAVTVTPGAGVTVCFGQNATITVTGAGGTGPYTYAWTDALGNPVGASSTITVTPATVGVNVYTVSVTDVNGCGPVTTTVNVTMNPQLSVTASADQSICPGTSTGISAVGSGGNGGPYTYTWTNNVNTSTLSGADQTVTPTASSTTYTVTLTDGCGTPAITDVVIISWYALPAVNYSIDNNQGCTPVVVTFNNLTAAGASPTITWDFGDGTTATGGSVTHSFTGAGCYDINLDITTTDGCSVDTTILNQICVFPYPVPDFTFSPNPTDVFNTEISFTNMTIGGNNYAWNFAGLGTDNATNPSFTFPSTSGGEYEVCLFASNNQGCADSICHTVVIDDVFLLYVPNSFSPNGDGVNDIFLPIVQGFDPETLEILVFNRWGEVIFKSSSALIGWDGTHKGMKSKEDVYVWKVKAKKSVNEDVIERIGNVNLIR